MADALLEQVEGIDLLNPAPETLFFLVVHVFLLQPFDQDEALFLELLFFDLQKSNPFLEGGAVSPGLREVALHAEGIDLHVHFFESSERVVVPLGG